MICKKYGRVLITPLERMIVGAIIGVPKVMRLIEASGNDLLVIGN